jgi:phosphoribosylformylglycinamidine cyclo-ligase
MSKQPSAYAQTGVDYTKLEPFKHAMIAAGKQTITFPNKRDVYINSDVLHSHGGVFEYRGTEKHMWCNTQEGLGNKNWIAEWMYENDGTGRTHYEGIAIDVALMAVNDVIAQGAMPVVYTDEVAAGDSDWFADEKRAADLAQGFLKICKEAGMALPAGESPALPYLINAKPPVKAAPSLSGCVTAIIAPSTNLITGTKLAIGDAIIGVTSSGIHANGISLVIKKAMELPDKFLTKLPNGNTLGEETLIPTRSYVSLVETLMQNKVDIHALLPGTGSGVAKVSFDSRPATYRIHTWTEVPPLMLFMQSLGISLEDCLKTWNWGIGYYIFVPKAEVERTLSLGKVAGYEMLEVGVVEEGERKTIFEPAGITLAPAGE